MQKEDFYATRRIYDENFGLFIWYWFDQLLNYSDDLRSFNPMRFTSRNDHFSRSRNYSFDSLLMGFCDATLISYNNENHLEVQMYSKVIWDIHWWYQSIVILFNKDTNSLWELIGFLIVKHLKKVCSILTQPDQVNKLIDVLLCIISFQKALLINFNQTTSVDHRLHYPQNLFWPRISSIESLIVFIHDSLSMCPCLSSISPWIWFEKYLCLFLQQIHIADE